MKHSSNEYSVLRNIENGAWKPIPYDALKQEVLNCSSDIK